MTQSYVYWISTALLSLLYLASATMYLAKRAWVVQALTDLGYPGYLVPFLTAVKLLGVAAILARVSAPRWPARGRPSRAQGRDSCGAM